MDSPSSHLTVYAVAAAICYFVIMPMTLPLWMNLLPHHANTARTLALLTSPVVFVAAFWALGIFWLLLCGLWVCFDEKILQKIKARWRRK
jgi:hypothetical protein